LGRRCRPKHRGQILRANRATTYAYAHSNCNINSYSNTNCYGDSDSNSDTDAYTEGDANTEAPADSVNSPVLLVRFDHI